MVSQDIILFDDTVRANIAYAKMDASEEEINQIKSLPFIKNVIMMPNHLIPLASINSQDIDNNYILTPEEAELVINQTQRMGGSHYSDRNIDGKNIRIAIFDAGFPSVDTHPAFEHIRKKNKIMKTWDFLKNKDHVYGFCYTWMVHASLMHWLQQVKLHYL